MASAVLDLMQDDTSNEETFASRNHIGDVKKKDMREEKIMTTMTTTTRTARLNSSNESDRPYFIIRGSVDGIRDELVPAPTIGSSSMDPPCGSPGDDSWMFRKVIVECKHRMNRLQPSPPLYEQIQAITYCFMYQVEDADLVQVLRKPVSRSQKSQSIKRKMMMMMKKEKKQTETTQASDETMTSASDIHDNSHQPRKKKRRITNYFSKSVVHNDHPERSVDETNGTVRGPQFEPTMIATGSCMEPITNVGNSNVDESCDGKSDKKRSPSDDSNLSNRGLGESSELVSTPEQPTEKSGLGIHSKESHVTIQDSDGIHDEDQLQEEACLDIAVDRITVEDPIMQHRHNWDGIILPRLRSWTDAVYSARRDDNKRYRLLVAMSDPDKIKEAWEILFHECPWLRDCDTGYLRDIGSS